MYYEMLNNRKYKVLSKLQYKKYKDLPHIFLQVSAPRAEPCVDTIDAMKERGLVFDFVSGNESSNIALSTMLFVVFQLCLDKMGFHRRSWV